MLDEEFARTVDLVVDVLDPLGVIEMGEEVVGVDVTEGAVALPDMLRQAGADVDLDDFEGFVEDVPEADVRTRRPP